MKTEKKRRCIYPKDIQRITEKSYRQSISLLQKVSMDLKKLENVFLNYQEMYF